MFNHTHFIRTFKGEELLIQTNAIVLHHEIQMILRLCDGKFSYAFLQSNVKRINNFADIVQNLINDHLITPLTDESLKNFHLNRALLGYDNIERRSSNRTLAGYESNFEDDNAPKNQKDNYKNAIATLSSALSQLNSDQLSTWLIRAETCSNDGEFNQLLDNFRAIYSKLVTHDQASDIIRAAIQLTSKNN